MQRPKGQMRMDLFHRIIDDATEIPRIDHVCLTGLGETLLDPNLVERLRYVRTKMPAALLDLYTNGTFLRPKRTDQILDAGVTAIYISLNAVSAEKRQAVMGLDDFDTVIEQIEYAIRAAEGRAKVYVKAVGAKDLIEKPEVEAFLQRWGGSYTDGGHAFVHLEGNWAGKLWPIRIKATTPCDRALDQIMVLWDGRVTGCCHMGEGEMIFGDLQTQTIREVYNSPDYVAFREAHAQGRRESIPTCAGCTSI